MIEEENSKLYFVLRDTDSDVFEDFNKNVKAPIEYYEDYNSQPYKQVQPHYSG